jgi:hypothetical protein
MQTERQTGEFSIYRAYSDLVTFTPSADIVAKLTERHMDVQHIGDAYGDVNFDFYSVLISQFPTIDGNLSTPASLLQHVRTNFASFMDPSITSFGPEELQDAVTWGAADSTGTVMRFGINALWGATDNAAVVCAQSEPDNWIFTTLTTPRDWMHPVTGNRMFGIKRTDGGYVFFTRGADRLTSVVDFGADWQPFSSLQVFAGGDQLWRAFLSRLLRWINSSGGKATVGTRFSRRYPWFLAREIPVPTPRTSAGSKDGPAPTPLAPAGRKDGPAPPPVHPAKKMVPPSPASQSAPTPAPAPRFWRNDYPTPPPLSGPAGKALPRDARKDYPLPPRAAQPINRAKHPVFVHPHPFIPPPARPLPFIPPPAITPAPEPLIPPAPLPSPPSGWPPLPPPPPPPMPSWSPPPPPPPLPPSQPAPPPPPQPAQPPPPAPSPSTTTTTFTYTPPQGQPCYENWGPSPSLPTPYCP